MHDPLRGTRRQPTTSHATIVVTFKDGARTMVWTLEALSSPIHLDAQKHPIAALLVFSAFCLLVWFFIRIARRRDERRARVRDLSQWSHRGSRPPPRR
jgi:hypothetical protein